jgi:predicted DNA-binding transcriptional regulator AlpA
LFTPHKTERKYTYAPTFSILQNLLIWSGVWPNGALVNSRYEAIMSLIRYKYLEENGIISNRMQLARAIARYGFPKPIALGENTLAWQLDEIEAWLASRPRITPKSGAKQYPAANAEAV